MCWRLFFCYYYFVSRFKFWAIKGLNLGGMGPFLFSLTALNSDLHTQSPVTPYIFTLVSRTQVDTQLMFKNILSLFHLFLLSNHQPEDMIDHDIAIRNVYTT